MRKSRVLLPCGLLFARIVVLNLARGILSRFGGAAGFQLLKHVTQVQGTWLEVALAAPGLPVDDRTMQEQYADHAEGWTWHDHDTIEAALASYDVVCARVLDAVRTADPDTAVPVPPAPWNPTDIDAWSVRWVWFHLIEELARHAGHADIVREGVDGATMYELVAGREGWPETDWLKPWHPPGRLRRQLS